MSELELQKLQKKYGETIAVRKVDLVLNEPKFAAFWVHLAVEKPRFCE